MSKIAKAISATRKAELKNVSKRLTYEPQPESKEPKEQKPPGKNVVAVEEAYGREFEELDKARIIYPGMKDQRTERAFRDLRTTVIQKTGGNCGMVVVTSVSEDGGASFVAMNLAAAFAFNQHRTAIFHDCNFRAGGHYDFLVESPDRGFTDYVMDNEVKISDVIQKTGIPRLRLIPAGSRRDSASEMFTLEQSLKFFQHVRRRYKDRTIIVDAPPVDVVADTRVLLDICDHVLLVVPYGKVSNERIAAVVRELPKDKFLGIVMSERPNVSI